MTIPNQTHEKDSCETSEHQPRTKEMKPITIRLDDFLRDEAKTIVKDTGLDMSSVLRFCIKASLDLSRIASNKPQEFARQNGLEEFETPEFVFLVKARRSPEVWQEDSSPPQSENS